jgi:hypothetical protein
MADRRGQDLDRRDDDEPPYGPGPYGPDPYQWQHVQCGNGCIVGAVLGTVIYLGLLGGGIWGTIITERHRGEHHNHYVAALVMLLVGVFLFPPLMIGPIVFGGLAVKHSRTLPAPA